MELDTPEKEVEYKPVVQSDGTVKLKKKSEIKKGRKSKASGSQFELRVRKDLEEKGWVVDKWSNNLDLEEGKIVPCKRVFKKFAVDKGVMTIGTGFPDFVAFQKMDLSENRRFSDYKSLPTDVADDLIHDDSEKDSLSQNTANRYKIIGIEVKIGGKLDRTEKKKCSWYLSNEIFSEILVAKKVKEKNRVRVEYVDFLEIEKRMR